MMRSAPFVLVALMAASAQAQVLTPADTLGKGKQAAMLSENALVLDDTQLNVTYAMYIRGLAANADAYVSVGETHLLGERQVFVGLGGNAHLGKIAGNSISLFSILSAPLTGRRIGSAWLVNPAIVVSRPLTAKITVYSGINAVIPVGSRSSRFFTPPETELNVPAGASILIGDWGLAIEADVGKLRAVGLALSRTF
jgi:hypothetical protein